MRYLELLSAIVISLCIAGCEDIHQSSVEYESNNTLYNTRDIKALKIDLVSTTPLNNKAAYVPSQCYTKTLDTDNMVHNPCYSCHINSRESNYVDDYELQKSRSFGEYTKTNRFTNLFKDRSPLVTSISDEEISSYVKEDNYIQHGKILLA